MTDKENGTNMIGHSDDPFGSSEETGKRGGLPDAVNDVWQQAARHANISEYQRYVIRTLRGGDGSIFRMLRRFRVCEFKIDGRAVAPESFEPVEFARFLVHDMNHEITVVKQHPLALGQALARARPGGRST
mgnify:FL=1